jgi:hypothetical protein
MGLHHRESFGMLPLDDIMDPFRGFGGHAHASTALDYHGPKHWRDQPSGHPSTATRVSSVREVDLSVTQYKTPLLYAKIHGEYIGDDQEIDQASHEWDVNEEEYQRDVMSHMPDWVLDYVARLPWLHDAKATCLGPAEDVDDTNFEQIKFRFDPGPKHADKPVIVTYTGVWVNERCVLPRTLHSSPEDVVFLHDEFAEDMISAGVEELSYHFYLSSGIEYSIEGLYGIDWCEEGSDLKVESHAPSIVGKAVLGQTVLPQKSFEHEKAPQAQPIEPEKPKKKPTRGQGKNGVKLFTAIFYIDTYLYVEQIRSKDWSTVWADFQKRLESEDYDAEVTGKNLVWEENFLPFSKDARNVFMGQFWIDGKAVDVTLVNTKRGKPPGAEQFEGLPAYIDS